MPEAVEGQQRAPLVGERGSQQGTPFLKLEFDSMSERFPILFIGDLHWDHPKSDRRQMRRVLDSALEANAWIVFLGDTFCAMQGKADRRGTKAAVRREHQRDDYFTALTDTAAEWFEPYKKNIWMILDGNHETAIKKHHEIDLVREFIAKMGEPIVHPGYTSYAMIRLKRGAQQGTIPFWVAHGWGGDAKVNRGAQNAQRRAVTYPDARFLVTGHIHKQWYQPHEQLRLNNAGKVQKVLQEHFSVGTFKDEYEDGHGGWSVERGMGPTIPSVWWATVWLHSRKGPKYSFQHEVLD